MIHLMIVHLFGLMTPGPDFFTSAEWQQAILAVTLFALLLALLLA